MTANQIANASNVENARHNQVNEAETERHNRETERISELVAANNAWYQRETAALQDNYNTASLAMQKAQGDRKLELQAEMQDIQSKMNDATVAYNNRKNELQEELNAITKTYNENVAKYQLDVYPKIMSRELDYKERANEIAETRVSNDYFVALQKVKQERERMLQDFDIRFSQLSQEAQRIELAQNQWETNRALAEAQTSYTDVKKEQAEAETKLIPQQNIREWFSTVSNAKSNKEKAGLALANVALKLLGF